GVVAPGCVLPGDIRDCEHVAPRDIRPGNVAPGNVRPGGVAPGNVRPGGVAPGGRIPGGAVLRHVRPARRVEDGAGAAGGDVGDDEALQCEVRVRRLLHIR